MVEQRNGFQVELTMQDRFDNTKLYWKKAIDEGRAHKTEFYRQVFESPESELYREHADDEMIMTIARTLNDTWIGPLHGYGRKENNSE